MIKSFNRDLFDSAFFFEEEFGRTDKYNVFWNEIYLIKDILDNYYNGKLDLSNIKLRYDSMWPSEYEEKNKMGLPFMTVYFVSNVYPTEEILFGDRVNCIIPFRSTNTKSSNSLIILEDFFTYFLLNNIYVYYDKDFKPIPLHDKEQKLFKIQDGFIKEFMRLFQIVQYMTGFMDQFYNTLITKDYPITIYLHSILTFASIRRWLKHCNTLLGASEIDREIILPLIASTLHYSYEYTNRVNVDYNINWNDPADVRPFSLYFLYATKILELANFRYLDSSRREISFNKYMKKVDPHLYDGEINELEGFFKNVKGRPPKYKVFPQINKFPWE